jgi:hypothetical protein
VELQNVAFSGPAVLVNRFFVSIVPSGVRIAFAEQNGPQKSVLFRTAVTMSIQDGISLYQVVHGLLRNVEDQITKAARSPPVVVNV